VRNLETQLFICNAAPMPELLQPINNGDGKRSIFVKPLGGMWTSTWLEEIQGSDWVEWCRSETFGDPNVLRWHLLTPSPDARIAVIDSVSDLLALLHQYPREMHPLLSSFAGRYLDYERMTVDFDAIHLTARGQRHTHLSIQADLYGWDCECTLWFRWCFIEVKQIVPVIPKSEAVK